MGTNIANSMVTGFAIFNIEYIQYAKKKINIAIPLASISSNNRNLYSLLTYKTPIKNPATAAQNAIAGMEKMEIKNNGTQNNIKIRNPEEKIIFEV